MLAVPVLTPVTAPELVPPVKAAIEGLLELQCPPCVLSVSKVILPEHTCGTPVIAAGAGFTKIVFVDMQPVPNV
jgi:hypothetical protein